MATKLTPAKKRALEWFAANGPTKLIPVDGGPSQVVMKRLRADGLLALRAAAAFGLGTWSITDAGLSVLKEHGDENNG